MEATDLRQFPVRGSHPAAEEVAERVAWYDEKLCNLQQVVILLATWGEGPQLLQLEKIFTRLAEADRGASDAAVWTVLSWYPIVNLLYAAGIAALAARNYAALETCFHVSVPDETIHRGQRAPLGVAIFDDGAGMQEYFKYLPAHTRQYVPRSEYLLKALQPILEDLLAIGKRYEELFDRFEIFLALEYSELSGREYAPAGRFAWKYRHDTERNPVATLLEEAEHRANEWEPLKAGLIGGSRESLRANVETLKESMRRLQWL